MTRPGKGYLRHLPLLLLGIAFIGGLILRLYRLDQSLWNLQGFDEGRDIVVARHIIEYGESVSRGPLAAGGFGFLKNSPLYYYILAGLWFFTRSPLGVTVFWACLLSSQIVIGYFIGKRIWDKQTGLIISFLFALQFSMVHTSRQVLQPNLLPIFSTLLLLMFFLEPTALTLSLSLVFLLFPLHIHYGAFLLIPFGLPYVWHKWTGLAKRKSVSRPGIYVPLITCLVLLASWIYLTYTNRPFDQFAFFLYQSKSVHLSIDQFSAVLWSFLNMIWVGNRIYLALFTLLMVSAPLILSGNTHIWKQIRRPYGILLCFLPSLLLIGLYAGPQVSSYFFSLLPVMLILFALGLRAILHRNGIVGIAALILVFSIVCRNVFQWLEWDIPQKSFFSQTEHVSDEIYADYENLAMQNTRISLGVAVLSTTETIQFDGWGASVFWYFLEKKLNEPLVTLMNVGVNIKPRNIRPDILYLICFHPSGKQSIRRECPDRFKSVRDYLLPGETVIYRSDSVSVWRFRTAFAGNRKSWYYTVYDDLRD